MKKSIQFLAVGAMLLSSTFIQVHAQDSNQKAPVKKEYQKMTPEQKADKYIEKFSKDLNLSDAQKSKIKALKVKEMNEMKALNEKQHKVRIDSKKEIEKILTPDQLKKLEEIRKERSEKFEKYKGKKGYSHKSHHGHSKHEK